MIPEVEEKKIVKKMEPEPAPQKEPKEKDWISFIAKTKTFIKRDLVYNTVAGQE